MDKKQSMFLRHLANAPKSQIVPTLRSAKTEQWKCIHDLCQRALNGEFSPVSLPKQTKRWFKGVASNKHKNPATLRRSVLQRGGSKAELIGSALKALAKVAAPAIKKAGKAVLQKAASSAIESGSEKIMEKIKSKKTIKPEPKETDSTLSDDPSVEELLHHKF